MTRSLEIACDESGYEGDKLIGATTEVFAHASVHMPMAAAADCVLELRDRIRSPATEYKAGHVLREKHRAVLRWFLGPQSPVVGHAHVFLIDKPFYVLSRVCEVLLEEPELARATAQLLYREGRPAFGASRWEGFLAAANALLRVKERRDGMTAEEAFSHAVTGLAGGPLDEHLARLQQAHRRAALFRAGLQNSPELSSLLDPLIPAIVRAVAYWGKAMTPVTVVHDQQSTLRPERVERLRLLISPPGSLAGLVHVESAHDPRVQLADIVAGAVRKLAEDTLNGRGPAGLHPAMLRPFVDEHSIWGDAQSWAALTEPAREPDPAPQPASSPAPR